MTEDEKTAYQKAYAPGTRIRLIRMGPDPRPVPEGTCGTVLRVDGLGTVHCLFDDGRQLGLLPGTDVFAVLGCMRKENDHDENED